MATFSELLTALRTRVQTQVADVVSAPLVFDNESDEHAKTHNIWLRASLVPGDSERKTKNRVRHHFNTIIDIFIKVGLGTKSSDQIVDIILAKGAFRSVQADGITYRVPTPQYLGRSEKFQAFFHTQVSIPSYGDILNV
jgi:hypothetical protein